MTWAESPLCSWIRENSAYDVGGELNSHESSYATRFKTVIPAKRVLHSAGGRAGWGRPRWALVVKGWSIQ